jgi:hypothetical protein
MEQLMTLSTEPGD